MEAGRAPLLFSLSQGNLWEYKRIRRLWIDDANDVL